MHQTRPPLTGITFSPASHLANSFPATTNLSHSEVLKKACPGLYPACKQTLHCSLGDTTGLMPNRNGFVHTVLECYNNHRALVLRPDVWFAIMMQFCRFVNGRAGELRSLFVLHEGKEKLVMVVDQDPRAPVDMDSLIGTFAEKVSEVAQAKIIDPELRSWMLPTFSTTARTDLVAFTSVMLGTVKEYFSYCIMLLCGIPRVTLLGVKQDWEDILNRVEKLKVLGSDAVVWYCLLHPILFRFV